MDVDRSLANVLKRRAHQVLAFKVPEFCDGVGMKLADDPRDAHPPPCDPRAASALRGA